MIGKLQWLNYLMHPMSSYSDPALIFEHVLAFLCAKPQFLGGHLDVESNVTPPVDNLSKALTKYICVSDQKRGSKMIASYLLEYGTASSFQNNSLVLLNHLCGLIFLGQARPTHLVDA